MIRDFFKVFLFSSFMFAATEGYASSDLNSLYQQKLLPTYEVLKPQKDMAKKRKIVYLISAALAVILFLVFAKFFKLTGVIVALVMIAAGYFVFSKNSSNIVGNYERVFKEKIITPIAQNCCGYSYKEDTLEERYFKESDIFAPSVKQYASWDVYGNDNSIFTYIRASFDTKESASVERMNENIFEGYFIIVNNPNQKEGILVSDGFREKIANMDLEMSSFFANAKRGDKVGSYTIYGEVNQKKLDQVTTLANQMIAISYKKDKTYIALYKKSNPLRVDALKNFDLKDAKSYEETFKEISALIQSIR